MIVKLGFLHISFKKQINKDRLIKLEFWIIFNQFLVNEIIVNPIELEHKNIRWSTNPSFYDFLLTFLFTFVILDFILSASLPALIQLISFFKSQLNRTHFIWLINCLRNGSSIAVNYFRYLNLASHKVFKNRVIECFHFIVSQNLIFIWIYNTLEL